MAEQLADLVPKVIELVKGYGQMESSEWEDEDDAFEGVGEEEMGEGILEKMFGRIVN